MSSVVNANTMWDQISQLSEESILPKLNFLPEDKTTEDFESYFYSTNTPTFITTVDRNKRLRKILELLKIQLRQVKQSDELDFIKQMLCKPKYFVLFLSEQADGTKPWSSAANAALVAEIILEVQVLSDCSNTVNETVIQERGTKVCSTELLLKKFFKLDFVSSATQRATVFNQIMLVLRGKLRKSDWKFYPAAANGFRWILFQVEYPYLSDFINNTLPPALLFLDDYHVESNLMGIECVDYVISNVNKAELLHNNWAYVIYSECIRLLNSVDLELVDKLIPTLCKILKIIEKDPNLNSDEMTKYDETLKKILFCMEMGTGLKLKKVWMPHLTSFLQIMGHATLHWVDMISDLLLEYTTCNDPHLWKAILECTDTCIRNTWIKPKSDVFSEIILRIVFNASVLDINDFNEKHRNEILDMAKSSLALMKKCDDFASVEKQIQEIIGAATKTDLHSKFITALSVVYV